MLKVDKSFPDNTICVMGLGYVGLTLAAVMANVGFKVIGIEIRDDVVAKLKDGVPHFHEPGLEHMLKQAIAEDRFEVHKYIPDDCPASVYIVTVGTPLDPQGKARLDMVESVVREIGTHAKDGDMLIMRSTVQLGTSRNLVLPLIEATGKKLSVAFCPERTIEGKALSELRQLPQIVGSSEMATTMRATQIFQFLTPTVVRVENLETAEMIKLIDNVQRDVQFAFANEVAAMCDAAGVSAHEVISSGKLGYPRTNLPLPGPVGGPCLSKDPYIFAQGLAKVGAHPAITMAARATNERQFTQVAETLSTLSGRYKSFPKAPVISLLGLAFKGRPATNDLRGSTAKPIFEALKKTFPDADFRGFDPMVSDEDITDFGVTPMPSLETAFDGAHIVLILNNHRLFETMPVDVLAHHMAGPGFIYDLWHHFTAKELRLPASIGYLALGSHSAGRLPQE